MITKAKKSITLSNVLLEDIAAINKRMNISQFIESALVFYLKELKKKERGQRDTAIINANKKRFIKEAEENLEFQDIV